MERGRRVSEVHREEIGQATDRAIDGPIQSPNAFCLRRLLEATFDDEGDSASDLRMDRLYGVLVDDVAISVVDEKDAAFALVVGGRGGDDLGAIPIVGPPGPKGSE